MIRKCDFCVNEATLTFLCSKINCQEEKTDVNMLEVPLKVQLARTPLS